MAKITFGFKNINGNAFDIRVVKAPDGSWPSARTVSGLRTFIVKEMNRAGKSAEAFAKSPGWSPRLTGALINSIKWIRAEKGGAEGRIITGALSVGVPYGRRQEFENKSKGRYLARAIEAAFPEFIQKLRDRNVLEDIIFGRRKQFEGGQRF